MSHAANDGAVLRELAREYADLNWSHFGSRLAPVPLLLNDSTSHLGRFTTDPRGIELSRALVFGQPWGVVIEVLKHEMAHQFVCEVLHETSESSHGPSFRRVCERIGVDPAASGLPPAKPTLTPIIERIRKLLALAGSPNQHEAEAAMRMAHRLMLRHNLQAPDPQQTTDGYGFRHVGRASGRQSEAERLLAGLLGEFFFVNPIWVSVFRTTDNKRVSVLEISGRQENLAMAEYVHGFLLHAGDSLWRKHKQQQGITHNADRREFLAGVMRGFADKLRSERKTEAAAGLVWVSDPHAERYFRQRHPRVRTTRFGSNAHGSAGTYGRAAGRELVLSRPLGEGPSARTRALAAKNPRD